MLRNNQKRPLQICHFRCLLILLFVILFLCEIGLREVQADEKQYAPLSVDDYEETFSVSACTLKAMRVEEVAFSQANMYFEELLVEDGQYVEKGQVLATFTVERDQSTLEQARLSLKRKKDQYILQRVKRENELKEARAEVDAMGACLEKDIASLQVDLQENAYLQYVNEQKYSIYVDELRLKELEETYQQNQLIAPISGIVFVGDTFKYKQGDPVPGLKMRVADPQSVRIVLDNGIQFHYGMDVTIRFGFGSKVGTYHGVIRSAENLLPAFDLSLRGCVPESSVEAAVIIDLPEGDLDLADLYIQMNDPKASFRGVVFDATVRTRWIENVLILNPRNAIQENGEYSVMILDEGSSRKQKIIYGVWNRRAIWVLGGITAQTPLAMK